MFNLAISLFVWFELCYYLLIAQTGIVEVFNSNLFQIGLLPIGGVIGSYLSSHLNLKENIKVYFLLLLQTTITMFYPDLNMAMLFLLGIAVGGMAPLIINSLKKAGNIEFIISLSLAYAVGTFLFNYDPHDRRVLGLIFCIGASFFYLLIDNIKFFRYKKFYKNYDNYSIIIMTFWVFLDSALFETLSRDISIPIWRGGYLVPIISFHILGVVAGVYLKFSQIQKSALILILFALSYLFYFIKEPYLLSIVYPFVISFYNVAILQSLVMQKDLKKIGIFMIFIGWIASGAGLVVALEQLTIYVPILILIIYFYLLSQLKFTLQKEVYHG